MLSWGGKGEDLIEGWLDGPGNDYIDGGDDNDMLLASEARRHFRRRRMISIRGFR